MFLHSKIPRSSIWTHFINVLDARDFRVSLWDVIIISLWIITRMIINAALPLASRESYVIALWHMNYFTLNRYPSSSYTCTLFQEIILCPTFLKNERVKYKIPNSVIYWLGKILLWFHYASKCYHRRSGCTIIIGTNLVLSFNLI